ncbi:substrate-binding domain-containing protein [Actinomycetospora cinnamomea]|uniref:Amino acid/amide ABC transporter substrate-binding protein (HAAT family) n=1 Tax=Actinomycetospora cinnamomea TaxID=663609 RepID=A0A2U1EXC4_9PSEU|nr:substrate-binding domain-containing protein [Actinomycetospora cinnamomea]PVZ04603.1 amino acid/amide ABC transporter substrate-binding protein (HAAT family) [Actinomycetospora cinnamomea]
MANTTPDPWRVAMVVPLRGPAGLFAPSCEAVAALAVDEVNARGGILGREVVAEIVDGGDEPWRVAAEVRRRVDTGAVQAVSGWHISSVREALAPVLAGRVPYAYPSLYEGGELRPGVFCCGETPEVQIAPALRWLRDELGVRRWFVVGDDYVWPQVSARAVRGFAHELGLDVVGEAFVTLGAVDRDRLLDRVERAACDGVLMLLVGQDAVEVNREFARRGLDDRLVRFSPLMEENMLLASGPDATANLFVAASYFRSMATTGAMDLLGGYLDKHGPAAPALSSAAESCYEGLHTLAALATRAGTDRLAAWDAVVDGTAWEGPRGTVEFRGRRARQPVHLAVADGVDFDVLTALPSIVP